MHDSIKRVQPRARSHTSVYDLIETTELKKSSSNYKRYIIPIENLTIFPSQMVNFGEKKFVSTDSKMLNETSFVTSEGYHSLNKKTSDKSVIRSTSTFFYDLDSIAKRHSYHCVAAALTETKDIKQSNVIVSGFGGKSEAIVQECATQMKPKLLTEKNIKESKKKVHKTYPDNTCMSSEIFLRDNDGTYSSYIPHLDDKSINDRHQKFWSFAKYRTEFTNPVSEEKKKDRGKRTEDPCPCQLFSYACPCTNQKSLTELAKNSKSLTVADQITSTTHVFVGEQKCNKRNKTKKKKDITVCKDKLTSTLDIIKNKSKETLSNEPYSRNINENIVRKTETETDKLIGNTTKIKSSRKPHQIVCPNCKEMIDIMSCTEDEESLKSKSSPHYQDLSPRAINTYPDLKDDKSKIFEAKDICNHDPQCELVPVCQILPTDNVYTSPNIANNQSPLKPSTRVIRITKGCRHHPPCTVVPSCQRMNVLNNNCEYIPPCLHRPRCVNLPLCAPLSKSVYYEEPINKPEQVLSTTKCLHLHQNRYVPTHQEGSTENQINVVQNTCEYLSEYTPRFVLNSTLGCISPMPSPCQPVSLCNRYKSEKSCQFDFLDWKQDIKISDKEELSHDDVVYIRDVGCQFRNKNNSLKESVVQSKTPSSSFNCINMNVDKHRGNFHTLRYEDKYTIPISGDEISISTVTFSSTEIDSQCPTHGMHHKQDSQKCRPTGFVPKSNLFVGHAHNVPMTNFCSPVNDNFKKKKEGNNPSSNASMSTLKNRHNDFSLKSRSSFLKRKYKNMFSVRRRRKSWTNYNTSFASYTQKKMSKV